ncbi:MAG: folylpolyglutamate synthase/dihydrofolate synthase family protein [Pseudomonadota bacterium]
MKFPFWPDQKGYRDIELGLSRVYDLLARLGNPHLKIPPTIHIAGTNGKGSTLAFLRTIFTEANLSIHTYTSPHLVNFNERIVLNGKEISDEFLNESLHECKKAAEKFPEIAVTYFEGITVAAFLAFSRVPADLLLLETGMGGRLDATNVLPKVLAAIITPISFDHTDFLGNTLAKIAFEKGGIIKKNCPVLVGKQKPSALKTLETQVSELNSEFKSIGKDWKITKQKQGFLFEGFGRKILLPSPSLLGSHQIENAALAIAAALNQKRFPISDSVIKSALTKTVWPARLQKIKSGKFFKMLPENCELYLDGSHNLQGAATILEFLKNQENKKILVIFSMLQDKNCADFLKKISPEVDELLAMEIPNEAKSYKVKEIKEIAESVGIKVENVAGFEEAFAEIIKKKKVDEDVLILVCGSLYLAGSFLEINNSCF